VSTVHNPTSEHEVLPVISELDRLIFTGYGQQASVQDDDVLRLRVIRESVTHHIERCSPYARFARQVGFELDSLQRPEDLDRVPQFPTNAFKRGPVLSVPVEQTAKRCTSSGTKGTLSVVHRDRLTIERLLGATRRGLEMLGDWYEDEVRALILGPNQAEAGDLWLAYVMSLIAVDYPTSYSIVDGEFSPQRALVELEELVTAAPFTVLAGPPTLVLAVALAARQRGTVTMPQLAVVTAGGWKRDDERRVDRREFTEIVTRAFGLVDDRQVRDAFNQVELNSVMLECHCHRKHVPPWLHITARSLRTLEPLPYGAQGLLSYLDPSPSSYPCFIVADDLGTVREGPCECGWPGRTLEIERRLERSESWGCALKMDRAWDGGR
jgi:long-chain-fatty-acid---luciferin-component ligase